MIIVIPYINVCFKSSEAVGYFDHLIRIIPQDSCVVKSLYTYIRGKSYLENAILLYHCLDLWGSHIFCLGFMLRGGHVGSDMELQG